MDRHVVCVCLVETPWKSLQNFTAAATAAAKSFCPLNPVGPYLLQAILSPPNPIRLRVQAVHASENLIVTVKDGGISRMEASDSCWVQRHSAILLLSATTVRDEA